MSGPFTESVVEEAALAWLESGGWQVRNGAAVARGEPVAKRDVYSEVVPSQWPNQALEAALR